MEYLCKKDFEEYEERNKEDHREIKEHIAGIKGNQKTLQKKMDKIYPRVSKDIEVANAWRILGKDFQSKTSKGSFWVKVVFTTIVLLFIIISGIITVGSWLKGIILH